MVITKKGMKDIAIYGAGGFGREIACLINKINEEEPYWNLVGFFDDGKPIGGCNEYGKYLGGWEVLNNWETPLNIVVSIGNPNTVLELVQKLNNPMIQFPNLISPDVVFMDKDSFTMGKGNIICRGCLISCNSHIGDFNSFNDFVSVGHDTIIGNYNAFMTATRISGIVTIGDYNFFGVNSCVVQNIKIGSHTTIAAGSAVIRRTKDGYTYIGVPASPLVIGK